MAKKKKDEALVGKPTSRIKKIAATVQDNIERLYQNMFYTPSTNKQDLTRLKASMNVTIDKLMSGDGSGDLGIANITKLYNRIGDMHSDKDLISGMAKMFDDKSAMDRILSDYARNKYLVDQDKEIDAICKYMPKLLEASDIRRDNVMSPDHFSKDAIFIKNAKDDYKVSKMNITAMKEKYGLGEKFEDWYDRAAKYGEVFLYIVPYKKAIAKLIVNKVNTNTIAQVNMSECTIIDEASVFRMDATNIDVKSDVVKKFPKITIEICQSNMLESVLSTYQTINAEMVNEARIPINKPKNITGKVSKGGKTKQLIDGELSFDGLDDTSANGLTVLGKNGVQGYDTTEPKLNIPGCIVKELPRENVYPIYIDDLCLGYYYLEYAGNKSIFDKEFMDDPMFTYKPTDGSKYVGRNDTDSQDELLKYVSSQISSYIDGKFVNANQDLSREIYMFLKYNDVHNSNEAEKIKVTFIPPEDMEHIYFKKDNKTNRGISDFNRAILPAKLWCGLNLTYTLGIMTRGSDKRVYYVNQMADTNIAKVLLSTIEQIKRSNYNIRSVENMNHLLNITGSYNDYIIPRNSSGVAPVEFEIMPGQNIEPKTELMSTLEESAVNSMDVALELISSRQSMDYAIQYSMSNSKFLKVVYKRQAKCKTIFSRIVTKIYNAEYMKDDLLEVTLPPPMFLNITNTSQIVSNNINMVNDIAETKYPQDDPTVNQTEKARFKKFLTFEFLSSFLDMDMIDRAEAKAKQSIAKDGADEEQQQ